MGAPRVIDFQKLYHSTNYGDFYILREIHHKKNQKRKVEIKFVSTGTEVVVCYDEALKGCVKDNYYPSIHGVGFIGNAHKKGNRQLYNRWVSMLARCYNPQNTMYKYYGAKGFFVDKRWHCFENFLNDVKSISGSELLELDEIEVELDKDIRQPNTIVKCYSKETCCWVRKETNNREHLIRKNNELHYSSKCIGVCADNRYKRISYQAQINLNGHQEYLGRFDNENAAANAYNYYADLYGIIETKNNCPFMTKEEWMKHKLSKRSRRKKAE